MLELIFWIGLCFGRQAF